MDIKRTAITIAIAILFALVVGLGIDAFYEQPEYDDFCGGRYGKEPLPLAHEYQQPNCSYVNQIIVDKKEMIDECNKIHGMIDYETGENGCSIPISCNTCNLEFDNATSIYNRNVFYITAPIGLAALLTGVYTVTDFLSGGFLIGGILAIAYGTTRYFSNMSKVFRFFVILIELCLLIWLGLKKLRKRKE